MVGTHNGERIRDASNHDRPHLQTGEVLFPAEDEAGAGGEPRE